jgi:hypothetical protein
MSVPSRRSIADHMVAHGEILSSGSSQSSAVSSQHKLLKLKLVAERCVLIADFLQKNAAPEA